MNKFFLIISGTSLEQTKLLAALELKLKCNHEPTDWIFEWKQLKNKYPRGSLFLTDNKLNKIHPFMSYFSKFVSALTEIVQRISLNEICLRKKML